MKTRIAIAAAGFVFTSLFFINLCNIIFACGCASLWAGADAHCNIHDAGAGHCPVCSHGVTGYALVFAAIAGPQLAVALFLKTSSWILRLAIVLGMFPFAGTIVLEAIRAIEF